MEIELEALLQGEGLDSLVYVHVWEIHGKPSSSHEEFASGEVVASAQLTARDLLQVGTVPLTACGTRVALQMAASEMQLQVHTVDTWPTELLLVIKASNGRVIRASHARYVPPPCANKTCLQGRSSEDGIEKPIMTAMMTKGMMTKGIMMKHGMMKHVMMKHGMLTPCMATRRRRSR